MCTNDHTEQTKPNFVCDALNPFLQSTSFKEKYISVQNITAFSTKSVYLFLAEWLGTPQKKILAKINCDSADDTSSDDTSSDDTSSNTKITSHDLTGFSHTIDDITIKVLVSPATTKEEAPPLVASPPMRKNNPDNTNDKKNNCPHRISFFCNGIYIFEYKRNSNGAADLITRRIFSTSPDTITLFVFIILYLSIQFNISTYRGQRLDWTTSENLMNSAAAIELIIYRNLSTSETSYNHRIKKRLLKNYITKRFSQEHLRNVNIVESINDRYIKTNWNVQVESMRRNLSFSSNSENLEKLNNVIAEKIVQTAPRYPLLSSILHIKNDNPQSIENIINLLRQICVITLKLRSAENIEVKVFIKPIIASTLQSFDGAFNFLGKKPRKYTKLDVLIFLGQLSQKMSAEADYSIAKSEMTQFCQAYTAADADTATEIFNDLITDAVGILIMNDTHYQFRHKQSRLVFFGIYSGMCENNSSETIKGINLLNLITENASSNQKTKEHIR